MSGRFRSPSAYIAWLVAIAAAAVLGFVTLGPASFRPHSALAGPIEDFIAYALPAGVIVACISQGRRTILVAAVAMIVFAGVLEAAQLFTPDRHGTLYDFGFKAAGVVAGTLAAMVLRRLIVERRTDRQINNPRDWLR